MNPADWTSLTNLINSSKNIIVITGAGISVSGGIPDFRSAQGLYNLVKEQYPTEVVKGVELFDASVFSSTTKTKMFYSFIAHLKSIVLEAQPTDTHSFLKYLDKESKLLRVYTQNIDDLDQRSGLAVGYEQTDKVIPLHGSLDTLVCTLCNYKTIFDLDFVATLKKGDSVACPQCVSNSETRVKNGKRGIKVGMLRPNIILYNEYHKQGEEIQNIQQKDLRKVDLVIVMGTSLKIVGVKRLLKTYSEVLKEKGRKMVLMNKTVVGKEWDDVFDFQVIGTADETVVKIRRELDDLKEKQLEKVQVRERTRKLREEKMAREAKGTVEITKFFKSSKVVSGLGLVKGGPVVKDDPKMGDPIVKDEGVVKGKGGDAVKGDSDTVKDTAKDTKNTPKNTKSKSADLKKVPVKDKVPKRGIDM